MPTPLLSSTSGPHELEYRIEAQPDGAFLIYMPEMPGLATEGATREAAIAMLRDALPAYVESLRRHRRTHPLRASPKRAREDSNL